MTLRLPLLSFLLCLSVVAALSVPASWLPILAVTAVLLFGVVVTFGGSDQPEVRAFLTCPRCLKGYLQTRDLKCPHCRPGVLRGRTQMSRVLRAPVTQSARTTSVESRSVRQGEV